MVVRLDNIKRSLGKCGFFIYTAHQEDSYCRTENVMEIFSRDVESEHNQLRIKEVL